MEIVQSQNMQTYGIQVLNPSLLLFNQKQFRVGPSFAKRWKHVALQFCKNIKKNCFVIEYSDYYNVCIQFESKEKKTTHAKKQEKLIPQKLETEGPPSAPLVKDPTLDQLEPDFIQCCQAELTNLIGPIASLFVKRTLDEYTHLTPEKFISILCLSISDPETAELFRQRFIP